MIKSIKKQRGDTLIEVIFAMVIIGVIIGVAIQGALSANRSAVGARQRTEATFQAQGQLELLRAYRAQMDWSTGPGTFTGRMASYVPVTPPTPPACGSLPSTWGAQFNVARGGGPLTVNGPNAGEVVSGNYRNSLRLCSQDPTGKSLYVLSTSRWTDSTGASQQVDIISIVSENQVN